MDTVNITINGREYTVPAGITILEAARQNGIHIPTLCFLKDLNQIGACRMCLVEVEGAKALQASCVYPVSEGMVGADFVQPRLQVLHLYPQRQLRTPDFGP